MTTDEFIEEIYDIAFGDNAINRDFSYTEVINQLRKESKESYLLEQVIELINEESAE
jgi:hypothetical protein|tara:strand:- start:233 stop:403 length:171 start_codon:yes stop_codon:yes gene_type:complete